MRDPGRGTAEREVALAAFGVSIETFEPWVLDRLAALLEEIPIHTGQILWSRGKPVDHLYFMQRGRVQARRDASAPWTFEGRWFLGGFEGHGDRRAERDLVALEDFAAFQIPRRSWVDLLEDSFALTWRTLVAAAGAVAELEERIPILDGPAIRRSSPVRDAPLTILDRIAFLTRLPIATGVGVQALADLAAGAEEVTLGPGEALFQAGAARDRFFVVVDGSVAAHRRDPEARRLYARGEIVTGPAALSDRARHWTAEARTPTRLLAIPLEAWFDLMEEHFELAGATMGTLAVERERILTRLASEKGPAGLVLI